MNLNSFPASENIYVRALFDQSIKRIAEALIAQKDIVDSHRPPTQADIDKFIVTSDDPEVQETLYTIKSLEDQLAGYKDWLDSYVKATLHSPANDDERQAARTKFNALKKTLIESLHSLGVVAADEGEQEVVRWVETFSSQIPKLNTNSNNHDLKAMRAWLQEHHPEAGIKSRGTIPLEWQEVYYKNN